MAKFDDILGTIGNTPAVRINKLGPSNINLYVKIEAFNPMGSVKDRLALGVIEDAEHKGLLKPGQTVIEATSGNTGIGLAMVCARKGYPLVVTMSENFSVERRRMMRYLGVRVVLTPAAEKGSGMLAKAVELAETHGWFLCRQFENEANANIHSATTAEEILRDFDDTGLDYWVTGFGTGGTLKGVARVLRERSPNTRIVVCEPDNSPVLGSGIAQQRDENGNPNASHPMFRPHVMQGWSPDFISRLTEDAVLAGYADEIIGINGDDAMQCARNLARQEGIFVGISAGATFAGTLTVARNAKPGSTILCMLPDTGERYLSTPLFEDILEDMNAEEIEISQSTPRFRFDTSGSAPASVEAPRTISVDPPTDQLVSDLISSKEQPVVMFALEWCEFCWSVRKLLSQLNIEYRSIDLDSVAYQENDLGGKIRAVLETRTGQRTIPQIFVAGKHIGGCTETFDAVNDSSLAELLKANNIAYDQDARFDAYSLLPSWLHPRPS